MIFPNADVAELADAQVSEACDGDIVEVQVLSSAPTSDESELRFKRLAFFLSNFGTVAHVRRIRRVSKYSAIRTSRRVLSYKKNQVCSKS
jgi:hypothetical protein